MNAWGSKQWAKSLGAANAFQSLRASDLLKQMDRQYIPKSTLLGQYWDQAGNPTDGPALHESGLTKFGF
jgi:hypothetical protein